MNKNREQPSYSRSVAGRLILFLTLLGAASASAQIVVVSGAKSADTALSKEQTADLFMGKATSLPSGATAILVDQAEASPLREEFYSKVAGKSASQAKAFWSKMSFTGKGTPPKEVGSSADIKKTIAGTAGAIGYIEKGAVDDTVKVVFSVN